jgi:hypothetical protein
MKKWFVKQPRWVKYLIHFVCSFFLFLVLFIFFEEVVEGVTSRGWSYYVSRAFVFSFIFEFFFNYIFFIPSYSKKKNENGAQA